MPENTRDLLMWEDAAKQSHANYFYQRRRLGVTREDGLLRWQRVYLETSVAGGDLSNGAHLYIADAHEENRHAICQRKTRSSSVRVIVGVGTGDLTANLTDADG